MQARVVGGVRESGEVVAARGATELAGEGRGGGGARHGGTDRWGRCGEVLTLVRASKSVEAVECCPEMY